MSLALVICALILTWPLLLLGSHTGTCTMGANGPATTGALLSIVPLTIAVAGSYAVARRSRMALQATGTSLLLFPILLSVGIISTGIQTWWFVLQFGTPCGEDYAIYGVPLSNPANLLILFSYLVAPTVVGAILITAVTISRTSRNTFGETK